MLLPAFSIPLAIFICFLMNEFYFMANRSSEQTRLDALNLSLCHQRRDFLETQIDQTNLSLKIIRAAMEVSASGCVYLPACPAIVHFIRAQSKLAQGIEYYQNARRLAYPAEVSSKKSDLKKENQLKGKLHLFWIGIGLSDGLKREELSSVRRGLEKTFQTKWPRLLEPHSKFERFNTFSTKYLPEVLLVGVNLPQAKWQGFKTFSHQSQWKGKATSSSSCSLQVESDEYKVVRKDSIL